VGAALTGAEPTRPSTEISFAKSAQLRANFVSRRDADCALRGRCLALPRFSDQKFFSIGGALYYSMG
jgi:hypothetical protein